MLRVLIPFALSAILPGLALADDVFTRADIAEAQIYGGGADVIRSATVPLSEGQHRVLIALPDLEAADRFQISVPEGAAGIEIGVPHAVYDVPLGQGALDTPAQAEARDLVAQAEEALRAAQDTLAETDAALRAIEAQQAYLRSLMNGGAGTQAMPADPALLAQFLGTIGTETARLAAERQAAQIARRDLEDAVAEARNAVSEATRALTDLRPFGDTVDMIAVDIATQTAQDLPLILSYFTYDAGWSPRYTLSLDTEVGRLEIGRDVEIRTSRFARWQDVAVTVSTADPNRPRSPSQPISQPARISAPGIARGFMQDDIRLQPEAMAAIAPEPMIVESAVPVPEFQGLSVRYVLPQPVTIPLSGQVSVPLDTLGFDVDTENRAAPRFDRTAFLIALFENTAPEPILPGEAQFYRDGDLIGDGVLPLIAPGAEADLAFGPLDHLQLIWIDRSLAEGDRGIFTTSTTQARAIGFGIENTGLEAEELRMIYAVPFAEQEDLDLELILNPRPSEEDIDGARGVHGWVFDLPPGESRMVEMEVMFTFPEGLSLDWRP